MTNERPEEHEAMVAPSEIRPWIDLKSTGLLWLLNASVLHPRGFALGLARDPESGEIVGWKLLGDGSEPWVFEGAADGSCDQNFADVEALFASARPGVRMAVPHCADPQSCPDCQAAARELEKAFHRAVALGGHPVVL